MLAKALAGFHHVIVDHPQRSETHVVGIEIIAEGKCVPAVQPSQLRFTALFRGALRDSRLACCRLIQCRRFHGVSFGLRSVAAQCFVLWRAMPFSYTRERMELRHLRYFVTVAEELNVSRASDRKSTRLNSSHVSESR